MKQESQDRRVRSGTVVSEGTDCEDGGTASEGATGETSESSPDQSPTTYNLQRPNPKSPHPSHSDEWGFSTRAVHSGFAPDELTGAVMPPIYLATTFQNVDIGQHKGFSYARVNNPTRQVLETCLKDLECAEFGFAFSSGVAAEDAVLRMLRPGDHLLFSDIIYGGTYRLITDLYESIGVSSSHVNLCDLEAVEAAWRPETKMVWLESPTNPLLTVVDIAGLSGIAHRHGGICVVDNTFASPYLQNPLALGADVVTHSTTKYISGHSDVVGGFAATSDHELAHNIGQAQATAGAVPSPLDCYLVLRGVMTLSLRVDKHCANAVEVAQFLDGHPAVAKVNYPGLASHPGHELARRQMGGKFGAMMSIHLAGGHEAAKTLVKSLQVFSFAESLGGVESLVSYPPMMSHSIMACTELAMPEDLVRLSIGIETAKDLIADLEQVLDKLA